MKAYFCTADMKKDSLQYLIAIFFISLYFFKGAATVWPVFFADITDKYSTEIPLDAGKESEKSVPEESTGKEFKEFYPDNIFSLNTQISITLLPENFAATNAVYQQTIYLSIPTPPPKTI